MRSNEEILRLWRERKEVKGPALARMDSIQKANDGAMVLPLPEMDKVEKAAVANLINQGIDQLGARVASVQADIDFPSTDPGKPAADKLARQRRSVALGWWDKSEMEILDGKRARHLLAYASAPIQVKMGHPKVAEIPTWHIRSPLQTFPSGHPSAQNMCPDDCIFSYEVTLGFLQSRYSDAIAGLEKGTSVSPDSKYEVLEYIDADVYVMLVIGKTANQSMTPGYGSTFTAGAPLAQLIRVPNRAEMCTVVIPTRTSLGEPLGKFDGMTGMFYTQAKLMALTLIAVERGVFPKEWLVGRPGELPEVLQEADPANGITGTLSGGTLEVPTVQPSYITYQTMDLLGQSMRQQGGLPQELGGESPTNVRTGKRGADILSAQMDFPIQEAQISLARAKEHEIEIAIALAKGYAGNKSVSFYVRRMKGKGAVTYTPNAVFTSDVNFVTYPHAGSDANQLTVLVGQLIGLELISEDTARQLIPLIDDPHHEAEATMAEALNKALLASIASQVQDGTLSAVDVAKIVLQLNEDKGTLAEAYITVHEAEQARQAGPAPDQGEPGVPGGLGAPGGPPGQPGLAPGPGGAPGGSAVPPTVAGPSPSQANLQALLGALHGGASSPQPAGAPAAA